jgi:hypothetical protein
MTMTTYQIIGVIFAFCGAVLLLALVCAGCALAAMGCLSYTLRVIGSYWYVVQFAQHRKEFKEYMKRKDRP